MSDLGGDPPCWAHVVEGDRSESIICADRGGVLVDLGGVSEVGSGAVWSLPHGGDLDANLVRLAAGECIGEHVNDEVDVLVFVQTGTGHLTLGDVRVDLGSDHLVLIPKGARRSVTAGPCGITYLSVHRRRRPMSINSAAKDDR